MMDLKTCFVIQRFDAGTYDKRYRETFAPAIERGGARPVRADEVLGTRPVVEKIEEGLRAANIAFAEISEDNPNVFLELGFALALSIPTVIVCDKAHRASLPFDIAHRPITFYSTEAQSDYEKISREVENAIGAALLEARSPSQSPLVVSDGLNIDEVKGACLLALLEQNLRSLTGSNAWEIQKEVAQAGISERMVALAIISLINDGLIQIVEREERDGDIYKSYLLSEAGEKYLLRSYSTLMNQEKERVRMRSPSKQFLPLDSDLDENVPF